MHTENVVAILQDAKRIILNCTYENDTEEIISDRNIRWKKQIKGVFKDLALFSPPGGQIPFIYGDMQSLYSNRTELIAPNSSLSAVMIIKDPVCSDEGIYQCWIDYFSKSLVTILTSNSTVEFRGKYVFFIYFFNFYKYIILIITLYYYNIFQLSIYSCKIKFKIINDIF